ncbi:hypothetical protein F5Y17DRAFT_425319, partial [Xylariaceae sp. FL0594]
MGYGKRREDGTEDAPSTSSPCFPVPSGVIGNKGQANYAAANRFLDGFASYRRSL